MQENKLIPVEAQSGSAQHEDRPLLAIGIRLLAVASLAIMFVFVKLAQRDGVHIVESVFWRQLTGLPVVIIWLYFSGSIHDIRTRFPLKHTSRMLVGLSSMMLNYWAITLLPLAEATTIGFAVPIFSSVLAAILLKEATGSWRWSAIAVGFMGILLVLRPGESLLDSGALIALGGAFGTALATIIIRQISKTETTGAIVFWFSLTSLVPLSVAMLFFAHDHDAQRWLYLGLLSLFGAIGQICLTASLRYGSVATVMPMDYSMLIWSIGFGWLIFGDLPAHTTWVGAPIVMAAGLVIVWREHVARQKKLTAADKPE